MTTAGYASVIRVGVMERRHGSHLNGAKFPTPSSEMVDTRAIGLGTTPLSISAYSLLSETFPGRPSENQICNEYSSNIEVGLTWDPLPQ